MPWAFVVAATDDPDVNAQVVTEAAACGVWVNDASSPGGGPAALPAVYRDGPLTVAVSTGGASPATAAWLRDEVAAVARSRAPDARRARRRRP